MVKVFRVNVPWAPWAQHWYPGSLFTKNKDARGAPTDETKAIQTFEQHGCSEMMGKVGVTGNMHPTTRTFRSGASPMQLHTQPRCAIEGLRTSETATIQFWSSHKRFVKQDVDPSNNFERLPHLKHMIFQSHVGKSCLRYTFGELPWIFLY